MAICPATSISVIVVFSVVVVFSVSVIMAVMTHVTSHGPHVHRVDVHRDSFPGCVHDRVNDLAGFRLPQRPQSPAEKPPSACLGHDHETTSSAPPAFEAEPSVSVARGNKCNIAIPSIKPNDKGVESERAALHKYPRGKK